MQSIKKEDILNDTVLADLSQKVLSYRWHVTYVNGYRKFSKFSAKKQRQIIDTGDLEACKRVDVMKDNLIAWSDDEDDSQDAKSGKGFGGTLSKLSGGEYTATPRAARNFFLLVVAEAYSSAQASLDRNGGEDAQGDKKKATGSGKGYYGRFRKANESKPPEKAAFTSEGDYYEEHPAYTREQWIESIQSQLGSSWNDGYSLSPAVPDSENAFAAQQGPPRRGDWDKRENQTCLLYTSPSPRDS